MEFLSLKVNYVTGYRKMPQKIWKCTCGWSGEEPTIPYEMAGGSVVDIIDFFCPECCNSELTFDGSKADKEVWWKNWYLKKETLIPPPPPV